MTWIACGLLATLLLFIVGGLDDSRRARAEARAELRRASAARHPASIAAHREAHLRAHAAGHALVPHIPRPRSGGDR